MSQNVTLKNLINKLKDLYYSIRYSNTISNLLYNKKIRVKIISTVVFVLFFLFILCLFEYMYPSKVMKDFRGHVNTYLRMGL